MFSCNRKSITLICTVVMSAATINSAFALNPDGTSSNDLSAAPAATTARAQIAAAPEQAEVRSGSRRGRGAPALQGNSPAPMRDLIAQHAAANGVPYKLADAVVRIESRYNPRVSNGGAVGLMQIKPQTARGVGFSGGASALYDANTNLTYGMRYLAQAYRMSGGNICATVMRYQSGHGAKHMSGANRAYCSKANSIIASR